MKKTLLYLFLLVAGIVQSQIVNIPDANFKAKLLAANTGNNIAKDINGAPMVVDANGDLEIQQSEALLVYTLNVFSNNTIIVSLEGLQSFSNLENLNCNSSPGLTSLDLSGCTALKTLQCGYSSLTVLDVSMLPDLRELQCSQNQLTSLNIAGLSNLESLKCGYNQLGNLDFTGVTNLKSLSYSDNQVTSLSGLSAPNLMSLLIADNDLSELDLTGFPNLKTLDCSGNPQLTVIDVSTLTGLVNLNCSNTGITTLDLTGLVNLAYFDCVNMPLATLISGDLINLAVLQCRNTALTELDLSHSYSLQYIRVTDNDLLQSINIKNEGSFGANWECEFSNNPSLQFMCVDEGEEAEVMWMFEGIAELPVMSTDCTFETDDNYNVITARTAFDLQSDGCQNDNDAMYVKIKLFDGINERVKFTNNMGRCDFYVGAGNFDITPEFENPLFNVAPLSANIVFPAADFSEHYQTFCILPSGVHPDVDIVVASMVRARPGFEAIYKIIYRNKGNQVLSGNITCDLDHNILSEVSILPAPASSVAGHYTWNYTNLLPFESREIVLMLNVNSPVDTPAVNEGDILTFTATATLSGTDETPLDNVFSLEQVVVNSLDPNNIICLQGATESVEAIGDYLHYNVNFENIGTAPASFVIITLEIDDAKFDLNTLHLLNASHWVVASIEGNTVKFRFDNINLGANRIGNVLFKLKTRDNLQEGDFVINQANIIFDYNFPLATNEAETIFEMITSGMNDFSIDNSVTIYPNPAENIIAIEATGAIQSVSLYDIQGRVLQTSLVNDRQAVLDISSRQSGVYFLKVATAEGVKVQQVVKK